MKKKKIRLNRVIDAFGHKFNNAQYTTNSYASKDAYLSAVYRANKAAIDNSDFAGIEGSSAESVFKNKVKEYMEDDVNISEAVRKTFRSEIFVSREERSEYFHHEGIGKALRDEINKDKMDMFKDKTNLQRVMYKKFNLITIDGDEYVQYRDTQYGFYLKPTPNSLHPYELVFVDNLTAGI